jgi:hypothetical protein
LIVFLLNFLDGKSINTNSAKLTIIAKTTTKGLTLFINKKAKLNIVVKIINDDKI